MILEEAPTLSMDEVRAVVQIRIHQWAAEKADLAHVKELYWESVDSELSGWEDA